MKKAVFLDRDGVINKTIFKMGQDRAPYSLKEFAFHDGVAEAIALLKKANFLTVMVTNQPDVARGWVERTRVDEINQHVQEQLKLDIIKVCFHTETDQCTCRKPEPGMLLAAAEEQKIDLQHSFMVGDRYSDIVAGKRAGCRTILVGEVEKSSPEIIPDKKVFSLLEGVKWILAAQ